MAAYRAVRERHTLLEICREPELAAEVTIQPVDAIDVDAAILFSDLLLPLEPMGIPFDFVHCLDLMRVSRTGFRKLDFSSLLYGHFGLENRQRLGAGRLSTAFHQKSFELFHVSGDFQDRPVEQVSR